MTTVFLQGNGTSTLCNSVVNRVKRLDRIAPKPRVEANLSLVQAARRFWLSRTKLTPEEIDEYCDLNKYPGTLEDELEQIAAIPEIERLCKQIKWNV